MKSRIGKRLLSAVLVMAFAFTTFCFADLGQLAGALAEDRPVVSELSPTITFYAPETIYLNPAQAGQSGNYGFKYFVDSTASGALRASATQTSGTIFFSISQACSSVSLVWPSGTSATVSASGSGSTYTWTITSGTTNTRRGAVALTVRYTLATGGTYSVSRNVYMYMPRQNATVGVGGAFQYKTAVGNEPVTAATVLLSGLHKVGGGNRSMWNAATAAVSDSVWPLVAMPSTQPTAENGAWPSGSAYDATYFNTNSGYSTAEGDGYTAAFASASTSGGGAEWCGRTRDGSTTWSYSSGVAAQIAVDVSRNTTLDTVPFLQGGWFVHYNVHSDDGTSANFVSQDGDLRVGPVNQPFREVRGVSYPNCGSTPYHMTGTTPGRNTTYTMRGRFMFKRFYSSTVTMNVDFSLTVLVVNKGELRTEIANAIGKGYRADQLASVDNWTTYVDTLNTRISEATTVLGNPEATESEISTALDNLTNALDNCVRLADVNAPSTLNGDVINMRGATFYVPETVYLNPSDEKSGQYVYGLTSSGVPDNHGSSLVNASMTNGALVYWSKPGATNVVITAKLSSDAYSALSDMTGYSVTDGISSMVVGNTARSGAACATSGWSASGSTFSANLTALTLSSAVTGGQFKFIEWTATYTYQSAVYQQVAYTAVYAPLSTGASSVIAATAHAQKTWTFHENSSICVTPWIAGATAVQYNQVTIPTAIRFAGTVSGSEGDSRGSYRWKYWGYSGEPVRASEQSVYELYENGVGASGFWSTDDNVTYTGGGGTIVVDSSRFSNYSVIPNLCIGIDNNYELNDKTDSVSLYYTFNDNEQVTVGSARNTMPPVRMWAGTKLNGAITANSNGYDLFQVYGQGIKEANSNVVSNAYCYLRGIRVNKTNLRNDCWSWVRDTELPVNWYTQTEANDYKLSIAKNFMALEAPGLENLIMVADPSVVQVNRPGGVITASHYTNNGSGNKIAPDEIIDYKYGDDIYVRRNEIPGYSFSSIGGSWTDLGTVQSATHNGEDGWYRIKNACQWSGLSAVQSPGDKTVAFYYTPMRYDVCYDLVIAEDVTWDPTGSPTGSGSVYTYVNDATFDDAYTLQAAPVRPGYTFGGWQCSEDGVIYAGGAQLAKWTFDADVVFTAQWTANVYSITYLLNKPDDAPEDILVLNPNDRTSYTAEDAFTIREATLRGYTFSGWTPSGTGADHGWGTQAFTSKTVSGAYGDVTLEANWVKDVHVHDFTVSSVVEPTCTVNGLRIYVCECGETYTEAIPALGHDYDAVVIAPTCTAEGYTAYTCSRCGDVYYEDYTEALGHDFGAWEETLAPTTATEGEEQRVCSRCGAVETRSTPKLPDTDSATFALTGGTARAGETIEVAVLMRNNPGIVSTVLRLTYDPQVLTLTDVRNGDVFPANTFHAGGDPAEIPYGTAWLNALDDDNTQNGTLVTYVFAIAANAPTGATALTLTYDTASTFDAQLSPVPFSVQNADWEIQARVPGDVSGDGDVNLKDYTTLIRSVVGGWDVSVVDVNADVNADGSIDMRDAALILRYLAGGWGVILR